jgi:hypothetical protein
MRKRRERAMGWIGTRNQMMYALEVAGADRDAEGNFLIYGEMPVSFLGLGEEYVVSDAAQYSVGGNLASLAALLGATSYGCTVHVICAGDER